MNHDEKHTRTNGSAPFGEEEQPASTPAPAVRKPISPAKLAANRRNGQKSKGPKTARGKEKQQGRTPPPAVRKPISPAKLAANRRKGQKSKGPKTEEGKSLSRWNALKHGVLSQRLVD